MSELPTGTSRAASQRAHWGRRNRLAVAAIGTLALVIGGALPASASPETEDSAAAAALELIAAPPAAGDLAETVGLAETDLTISGLPAEVEAGAPIPVGFTVLNTQLGAPDPTGEVTLVAASDSALGYEVLGTQELVGGAADMVVRPFGLGPKALIAVYGGDETHAPVVEFADPLTVTPVRTVVTVEVDSNSPAYGGGTLGVWVTTQSVCEQEASDADVRALCESTHGAPHGEVTLRMEDEVVGTQPLAGTDRLGVPDWLALDASLSAPETSGIVHFEVPVPDRALGTPERYTLSAEFAPTTWFAGGMSAEVPVATSAAATSTAIVLGDLARPTTQLSVGEFVDLTAYIGVEPSWGAAVDGVVTLRLNGEILVEGLPLEDGLPTVSSRLRFDEPGSYALVAEFVPHSLNHTGSVSPAYEFTVATPTPDGGGGGEKDGAKGDVTPAADLKPAVKPRELARTGADASPAALGAGALVLAVAGTALLLARRRRVAP